MVRQRFFMENSLEADKRPPLQTPGRRQAATEVIGDFFAGQSH